MSEKFIYVYMLDGQTGKYEYYEKIPAEGTIIKAGNPGYIDVINTLYPPYNKRYKEFDVFFSFDEPNN